MTTTIKATQPPTREPKRPWWWFAPRASAHLFHDFFPAKRSGRSGFFGSPGCLLVLFFVIAALYALVVVVCASLVLVVWVAQLVVLVPVGLVALVQLALRAGRKEKS